MPKLHLDWSDGRYSTRLLSDEEAAKCEELGITVAYLEDHVYETYLRDCARDAIWHSNEQSMRRREKALMPLEDAEREIARLKEELARAERMAKYFEAEWSALRAPRGQRHLNDNRYTCVYPQPGCDVTTLPAEWRHHALEILNKYSRAHAAEGLTAADFEAMLTEQNGRCAICRGVLEGPHIENDRDATKTRGPHIDHDHTTNKIRGLLCGMCNVAIAHFRDNAAVMLRAAAYIVDGGFRYVTVGVRCIPDPEYLAKRNGPRDRNRGEHD